MTGVAPAARSRLPLLARFWTVFAWGVARTVGSRRFVATGVVALIAGLGLGALVGGQWDPVKALWKLLDDGLIAIAVPLVALALVGTGFAEEVQDQTLAFHLVRPVSRSTVFVARYASGVVPGALVASAMTLAAVLASRTGLPPTVHVMVVAVSALGTATVGALYYALAALFRRGLVAGLVYTFVVEGFFQFLPGSIQSLSLMHHVRSVFHRSVDADFAERSEWVARRIGPQEPSLDFRDPTSLVLQAAEREEWTTIPTTLVLCAAVVTIALFVGARAVARRDFALKD